MADLKGFNAHEVDPAAAFEPIPSGKYTAIITKSEEKPTKNNAGRYLELTFQIVDGEHKGRLVWARLNLKNPNAQAVQFARAELSAICHAVGVMTPTDSVDLHNLPLEITVGQKKRDDTGEFTNEIKGYAKRGSAVSTTPVQNTTPTGGAAAPWMR